MRHSSHQQHTSISAGAAVLLKQAGWCRDLSVPYQEAAGLIVLKNGDLSAVHAVLEQGQLGPRDIHLRTPQELAFQASLQRDAQGRLLYCCKSVGAQDFNAALATVRKLDPAYTEVAYHALTPPLLNPNIEQWDDWGFDMRGIAAFEQAYANRLRVEKHACCVFDQLKRYRTFRLLQNPRILFLGCGNGTEVLTFIDRYSDMFKTTELIGVDGSQKLIQRAKLKLEETEYSGCNKVHFEQLDFAELLANPALTKKPFDLIVAIGVFDCESLSFEQGVNLVSKARQLLGPNGMMACSAYHFERFSPQNYRDMGFDVLQASIPGNFLNANRLPLSCFVLKETDRAFTLPINTLQSESEEFWSTS